uniref:Uncharacterized protein n=1 Tax=Angiostrongylus cantonensis TaxID=6313 RepID=A0A0K0CV37_ANGCA
MPTMRDRLPNCRHGGGDDSMVNDMNTVRTGNGTETTNHESTSCRKAYGLENPNDRMLKSPGTQVIKIGESSTETEYYLNGTLPPIFESRNSDYKVCT